MQLVGGCTLEELLPHHWQPLQPGLKADPPRSEAET
jgi:hypothetical protein